MKLSQSLLQFKLWVQRYFCSTGLLVGTLLFALSLTPTLLPRTNNIQGVISGLALGHRRLRKVVVVVFRITQTEKTSAAYHAAHRDLHLSPFCHDFYVAGKRMAASALDAD